MSSLNTETIRIIVENAVKNATQFNWLSYLIVILISLFAGFFGSYLRKKGENLASKEDISEITRKVEEVRSQYAERMDSISHQNNLIIEHGSQRHQLRMAALERRLETHQKAYTLWRKLVSVVHDEKQIVSVVKECKEFWVNNCLFLEEKARKAFINACSLAADHRTLLVARAPIVDIERNWKIIMLPGELLVKGVELPPIAEDTPDIKPYKDTKKS